MNASQYAPAAGGGAGLYADGVCLLVVGSRVDADFPLLVGANRDERMDRAAIPVTVLRDAGPRILGGRDEVAGGTWLAVNEHGVVAALTNQPSPAGRDDSKRSRGELPIALAAHDRAGTAVAEFVKRFRPHDYNRAWLLVGDRSSLYYIDMTGDDRAAVTALPPGVHVLGNFPLGHRSVKTTHVTEFVERRSRPGHSGLEQALREVLADHTIPPGAAEEIAAHTPATTDGKPRPPQLAAACVHTESYGTRSAAFVRVPAATGALPVLEVAPGPSCVTAFADAGSLWSALPA